MTTKEELHILREVERLLDEIEKDDATRYPAITSFRLRVLALHLHTNPWLKPLIERAIVNVMQRPAYKAHPIIAASMSVVREQLEE